VHCPVQPNRCCARQAAPTTPETVNIGSRLGYFMLLKIQKITNTTKLKLR